MRNFRNWDVWIGSIELTKKIYLLTANFPADEKFGLKSQIQRAAVSIPANISEGAGRESDKDLSRFLSIAIGSSFELETLLILAGDLSFIQREDLKPITDQLEIIQKQLNAFIQKLKTAKS